MRKIIYIVVSLLLLSCLVYAAITYDGLWFLGFNLERPVFQGEKGLKIRKLVCKQIDRAYLAKNIMKAEKVPDSFIPPGMPGYFKQPEMFQYRSSTENIGITLNLLHTDGVKTERIVKKIKKDLEQIGINLVAIPVNYSEPGLFEDNLKVGNYDLFLLGYKADSGSTEELLTI